MRTCMSFLPNALIINIYASELLNPNSKDVALKIKLFRQSKFLLFAGKVAQKYSMKPLLFYV